MDNSFVIDGSDLNTIRYLYNWVIESHRGDWFHFAREDTTSNTICMRYVEEGLMEHRRLSDELVPEFRFTAEGKELAIADKVLREV